MSLRSEQFDDIYFSREDGLAESRHTYLAGNKLPEAWTGRDDFTILELGFGTGLNFLMTLQAWQATAQPYQRLRYISVEKFPLPWAQIEPALAHWDELSDVRQLLGRSYPAGGDIALGVTLELHIGDVADVLPQLIGPVDAIYMDGFTPTKNPDMWDENVMTQLARLGRAGTTVATFSAAAVVRKGLKAAGFKVRRTKGFGRKWHMLTAIYQGMHGAARDS